MLATLRTIRWSIDSALANAARSAAIRSTAWRTVRAGRASPQSASFETAGLRPSRGPGRTRAEAAASSSRQAAIQLGVEDARVPAEFLGRLGERRLADVMAADHEVGRLGQGQLAKRGQVGHQPRAVGPAPAPSPPAPA